MRAVPTGLLSLPPSPHPSPLALTARQLQLPRLQVLHQDLQLDPMPLLVVLAPLVLALLVPGLLPRVPLVLAPLVLLPLVLALLVPGRTVLCPPAQLVPVWLVAQVLVLLAY